jgi:haloalkane dehalogenase
MNTWFWPADRFPMKAFSRVMSSRPLQRRILERNLFVERFIPAGTSRDLSAAEMDHYRGVQPSPAARVAVAVFPRQILAATPWLGRLAASAPAALRDKPTALVWGMRDRAFGSNGILERWRSEFPSAEVVILDDANHYVQEDAPEQIAATAMRRFG